MTVTYLLSLALAISTVNSWTLCCIADPLQDSCFSCICSSYDEDPELDLAELFGIHWSDGARVRARAGLFGTHWIDGVAGRNRKDVWLTR